MEFDSIGRHPYITVPDSNIAPKIVTRDLHSKLDNSHSVCARVLSLLLLGFIVYGTTIAAVHKHGTVPDIASTSSNFSDAGNDETVPGGVLGCSDCLICQLHQSFSSPALNHNLLVPAAPQQVPLSDPAAPILLSAVSTSESGRAPPITSLA